jgi:hypothetical protein
VQNLSVMQSLQTSYDLNEYVPDLFLFDVSLSLLIAANFLKNVSIIRVFHDQAFAKLNKNCGTYHKLELGSSMNASL